ncbi:hypothetical protein SORDD14_01025 [Streptococcus oralis]|uniref:Uncharacterized protein n=1 Tax=Streptococcus oralis TaxID=1303 RepID=A0A139P158_STROR|nr:hypothetical protein SORDD14_01025 [Streptococcus oralis]
MLSTKNFSKNQVEWKGLIPQNINNAGKNYHFGSSFLKNLLS